MQMLGKSQMNSSSSRGTKTKTINGAKAILAAFAAVLIGAASVTQGWTSFSLWTVAVILAAVALYFDLKHRHFKQRIAGCWAVVLVMTGVFLGWLIFKPIPPTPHFKLVLHSTSDRPKLNLELTNQLLFTKIGQVLSTFDFTEALVIPIRAGQTNVILNFALMPDSPAESDVAETIITIAKYVDWIPAKGWSETECVGVPSEMTKCIRSKFDLRNLLPYDWIALPPLKFSTLIEGSGTRSIMSPIQIQLRAKGMAPIFCGFWLMMPELTEGTEPQMLHIGKIKDPDHVIVPIVTRKPLYLP